MLSLISWVYITVDYQANQTLKDFVVNLVSFIGTTQILKYSLICHILDSIELAKYSSIF